MAQVMLSPRTKIVTILHQLRALVPDEKDSNNESLMYDDDFYESLITRTGYNSNAHYASLSETQYRNMVVSVWAFMAGDHQKIRKMEELGIIQGEANVWSHIRMLKFHGSQFEKAVFGEVSIP